ncbi:LuxR family transcriptional regulator [Actinomadura barringtoniae]|uniref:LuxR family transcriptional regulator n=1 Tax=Actinomadura barringtoniae TaxID=1427535 RepID=A0A939PH58_9ACTN|nr:LuxR C-terminal-related transcriptional regulator [Actinomadura barringtoniae]MBO2452158.1 LuxR family transcriptional regulator [Actinomadura barringtoniae]
MASSATSPSVSTRGGNLPAELTRFIGRRRELAEVRQELERARLVTLCGAGGVGKTRLAVKVAEEIRRHFADGCWLVELSSETGVQAIPRAVVAALEIPDRSGADPVDLLAAYLSGKRVLLVLDTCEHVADACAMLVEVLLRAAPGLQIIATSRRPLTILGEHTYQVHPFPVGENEADSGEAVELFVERVRAVLPDFEVSGANLPEVIELCRRLDGIPLALELAAMRLRVMALSQLVERLDDRFRVLGGVRIGGGRQQTLLTTVRWSYELCEEAERLLWARLAVFPGSFDLAAAESVCGAKEPDDEILDTLAGLVEKSIVTYDPHTGRYRMLDSIREYAGDLLDGLGERQELRRRHRDSYRAFVERAVERWCGGGQVGLFDAIRQAMPNLRAAFDYCLSTAGEERTGLEMISALSFFWFEGLELGTGGEWLEQALDLVPEACLERGWGLRALANVEMLRGDFERSQASLAEAMLIAETEPGSTLLGHVLHTRGTALVLSGKVADGLDSFKKAMSVFEERGFDDPHALCTMVVQAGAHTLRGETGEALALLTRCLPLCAEREDLWSEGFARWMRALTRWRAGEPAAAVSDLRRSMEMKESVGDIYQVALAFDLYAFCLTDLGEVGTAALLLGAGDALWIRMKGEAGPAWDALRQRCVDKLTAKMGEARLADDRARGTALSAADALLVMKGKRALPEAPAGPGPLTGPSPLTRRETQVAKLVAEGLSNRQIAERLVISKRTADSHLEHILTKLGFISRAQIAAWVATTEQRQTETQGPRDSPSAG